MSDGTDPKIEFPCDWSLRIIGEHGPDFEDRVCAVLAKHDAGARNIRLRLSRESRFASLNCVITTTGEPHLQALHKDLLATGIVRLVL